MKKIVLSTFMVVLVLLGSCGKFRFTDDDPKPDDKCINPKLICKNCACVTIYDPVCGCDGVTYGNACEAKNAGISKFTKGACGTKPCIDSTLIDENVACTKEYNPVCGCNGITYGNPCMAKKAGVTKYTNGACATQQCIDTSLIKENVLCTMEYNPVCGCNGITYSNPCNAENSGVTSYKSGVCSLQKEIITYSWTGDPSVDGCGSLLYKDNQELLIPEDEKQIPDSIRYLVTIAPAKYIIVYEIVKYDDQWHCGKGVNQKVTVVRIKEIYPY